MFGGLLTMLKMMAKRERIPEDVAVRTFLQGVAERLNTSDPQPSARPVQAHTQTALASHARDASTPEPLGRLAEERKTIGLFPRAGQSFEEAYSEWENRNRFGGKVQTIEDAELAQ